MNDDLERAISESWAILDGMKTKDITVQEAGVKAKVIQNVVHSAAIKLRERMFVSSVNTSASALMPTMPAQAAIEQAQAALAQAQ